MGIAKELSQLCYNLTGAYSEQTTARGVLNDLISKLSGTETGAERLGQALGALSKDVGGVVWGNVAQPAGALEYVNLPDGVTEIGFGAFNGCANLKKVIAPESLKIIGASSFAGAKKLSSITFPGAEIIGDDAFGYAVPLASTKGCFPKVKSIGARAFRPCEALTDFIFPELRELGDGATQNCNNIAEISTPKCEIISNSNFNSLTLSGALELPECREVGMAFFNSSTCGKVLLPKIEKIGNNSFVHCTFEALILSSPTKVCKLGDNCFQNTTQDDAHGWFYVPKHLLKQYKKEWSDLAERFRAIEDYPEIME